MNEQGFPSYALVDELKGIVYILEKLIEGIETGVLEDGEDKKVLLAVMKRLVNLL